MRKAGLTWMAAVVAAIVVAMAVPSFASALAFKPASLTPLPEMTGVRDIASGDFNEDGKDDLAVACESGVVIWLSNGDGTFTKGETLPIETNVNASAQAVVVGDFNGDGKLDVAYSDGPYKLYIALGKGNGTFEPPVKLPLPFNISAGMMAAGNLSGGTSEDIVLAGGIHNGVNESAGYQVISYELGSFVQHSTVPVPIANESAMLGVAIGDYTGDGKQDLALLTQAFTFANYAKNQIFGEVGEGNGTFTAAPENPISLGQTEAGYAYSEATANLDGTGGADLLVGIGQHGYSTLPLLGSSSGFLTADTAGTLQNGLGLPVAVAAANLTGSGALDQAITGYFDGHGSFSVATSDGTGKLTKVEGSPFNAGQEHFFDSGMAVGDFNGDGHPDIAIGSDANGGTVTQGVAVMMNAPEVHVSSYELHFGDVEVGQSAIEKVALKSTGAPPLEVVSVETATSSSPFTVLNPNACATPLANGEECEVEVEYTPTASGSSEEVLWIKTNAGAIFGHDEVSFIQLHGAGVEPEGTLSPLSQDFGTVQIGGTPVTKSFTIESTGGVPLEVSKVSLSSEADFKLASPSACVGSLEQGEECVVKVSFAPTGAAGERSATLTVETNAGPRTASLSGTAEAVPSPTPIPTPIPIPIPAPTPAPSAKLKVSAPGAIQAGKTVNLKVQVTNTGTTAISGLTLTVKVPKSLALSPKPISIPSLAAGQSVTKTIAVKVKSTAAKGKKLSLLVTASTAGTVLDEASGKVKVK